MNNLFLTQERVSQINYASILSNSSSSSPSTPPLSLSNVVLDAASGRLFLVTRALQFFVYSMQQQKITHAATICEPHLLHENDEVVAMHYLPELEVVIIASSQGILLTVSVHDGDSSVLSNVVGEISVGIADMKWSPDEELCIIYNKSSELVVMTKEFDVMYESPMFEHRNDVSEAQLEEYKKRFGFGSISWRGDGQFFVVNAFNPYKQERCCLVYDRQLELQSSSAGVKPAPVDESADGMNQQVTWRPSGNLIFTPAHRLISSELTKRELWLWEKNCLRHGEVSLGNIVKGSQAAAASATAGGASKGAKKKAKKAEDDEEDDGDDDNDYTDEVDETANLDSALASSEDASVATLCWNADSDILAVKLVDRRTKLQSIVLYTTSNYHWYLKQEIRPSVPSVNGVPVELNVQWHPEDARRLLVVESTGSVRFLDFIWTCSVNSFAQSRLTAVIDGSAVQLTPLSKCCVPPPMSQWRITLPADAGKIQTIAMRASTVGIAQTKANQCKFSLANQELEATAFHLLPADPSSVPSSASPDLISPTSDLLLLTSSGKGYLVENVEGALGNGMSSGKAVGTLEGVHEFTLVSSDFPLGYLRSIEWLDASPSAASQLPSGARASVSAATPAVLLAVESSAQGADALVELEVLYGEIQSMFRTPLPSGLNSASIVRIAARKQFGFVYVQAGDGKVMRYLPAAWQTDLPLDDRLPVLESASAALSLPSACPWFDVVCLSGEIHSVGRDWFGKLFIGSQLLTPQCSSFLANQHPLYLCFSILGQQNAVFLLDKNRTLDENMSTEFRSDPHNVRLVERGSTLVALIPSLTLPRLILQMPRGNLEAIYPRNFNLAAINAALSELRLKEAMVNMRKNKIDSNLLFDHFGFDTFKRIAGELVDQIGGLDSPPGQGVEFLNLFLSALTEESSIDNQYVKYRPLPLSADAERRLQNRESIVGGSGATSVERSRQELMKSVAEIRGHAAAAALELEGGKDDRSDLDSIGSDSKVENVEMRAVDDPAPYNYVPRKHGQTRFTRLVGEARKAASAITRKKEEARRDQEKADRAMREKLAERYEASSAAWSTERQSKVNFVCDLLRELFLEQEKKNAADAKKKGRYTLCIITTFLKNEPKNYDAALQLVKVMRDEEKANKKAAAAATGGTSSTRSNARIQLDKEKSSLENKSLLYSGYTGALQYMIFLSDIQTLYRSALGIYDFELVRLVAQYSHMDPKEYLAFLERLQALDPAASADGSASSASAAAAAAPVKRQPNFQHYEIDLYLGRWGKALSSLLAAWKSGEIAHDDANWKLVLDLLKQHTELYTEAIHIMTPESIRDQTRLLIGSSSGDDSMFGSRNGGGSMYGMPQYTPFDPTGGLPAHFLNPSLAPSAAPTSTGLSTGLIPSSSNSTSSSSSTPAAPQSDELTPFFSVVSAYAEHLSKSRSSTSTRHAAHAYLLCCEYKKAMASLKEAGDWKECIVLAYQLKYQPEEVQQLAYELAASLRSETKTALSAATLLAEYCDDVDEAIVILLGAELWFDILRITYSKGRTDLLETHVKPELLKAFQRHMKHIQAHKQRYLYATHRLRVIRRIKLLFPATIEEGGRGGGENGEKDDDLMSIVSGTTASSAYSQTSNTLSEASAFSGRSTATVASTSSIFSIQSDDRREMTPDERRIARYQDKLKRKRAQKKVKEGSIYEEEMMVKEVIDTTPLHKHKERISELIHALLHFGFVDQSRTLQFEFEGFLTEVEREEAKPMPMMENPTPEQREALVKYWNWPQMCYPERNAVPKTDHLVMPFLFPAPSVTEATERKRAEEEAKKAAVSLGTSAQGAAASASKSKPVADDEDDAGAGLFDS